MGLARLWVLALALLAGVAHAGTFVWVDDEGVTHLTDDPDGLPAEARERAQRGRRALRGLWDQALEPGLETLPQATRPPATREEARVQRLVRGAVADLERGENARAAVALRSILRDHPGRPEPHWYLALVDRHRGRYDSAEAHLEAFLASAGEELAPWREAAERRLAGLADERRLADRTLAVGDEPWVELAAGHFRVSYDAQLARASRDYERTVLRYLDEARRAIAARLGTVPDEPMGVVFYGRATYQRTHGHRFSFQTVGFFDGRIHVVSAAHPEGELRALLYHEYLHAVYREQTGSDRPYWFNEGLAELAERGSRGQSGLSRSERSLLRKRIDAGDWIPLYRLAPSFSGLDDDDARAAYLESAAAEAWITARVDRSGLARILQRLGEGRRADAAFLEVLRLDTDGIDAAVRAWVRSEFPPLRSAQRNPPPPASLALDAFEIVPPPPPPPPEPKR